MKLPKFLLAAIAFIAFNTTQAQVNTSTTMTFPDWGVADRNNATYYYIPGAETYYDIRNQQYVYMEDGKWTRSANMPPAYSNYDLYDNYKVVITDKTEPFKSYPSLRAKYPKDYKGDKQATIRPRK